MPRMRLDKLLSHLNCGSRKEVQAMIRTGRVTVDGAAETDPAAKVDPDTACVALDGQAQRYRAQRYYMLNKPAGVITASRDERHETVLDLFPAGERRGLFAVGRLDKDTEGLLIVTDDGALSHALMSPARHVSKVYEAVVEGELARDAAERFQKGLALRDGTACRPRGWKSCPRARSPGARHPARGKIPSGQAHGRCGRRHGGAAAARAAGWAVARSEPAGGRVPGADRGGAGTAPAGPA